MSRRGSGWTGFADLLTQSPERQAPPCPHFGACGGCTLQHWQDPPYAAWKTAQLSTALARAGYIDPPLAALARSPPASRRRADLALERDGASVRVGLHRHRAHDVVDLQTCLVLDPAFLDLITSLRRCLPGLSALRRTGSATVNLLDTGLDLLLRTDAPLTAPDRAELAGLAREAGLCRVAWAQGKAAPEIAAQPEPALLTLSGATVSPPPGAFLQASRKGEAAIVHAVLAALPGGRPRVIELFAGCGSLTFPLAGQARVSAFEGDAESVAALRRGIAGRAIEARQRDLARQPLSAKEIASADVIVLDPPFAGAAAQMPAIAQSGVARVVYVSCNPAALARDARALHAAGYTLGQAMPIDQFLWSAAVESVCVFNRSRSRRRG